MQVSIARSGNTSSAVSVNYTTSDGTAIAGLDYTTVSGTVTIPAGQVWGTIMVPILADNVIDPSETFAITLSNPVGATLSNTTTSNTIVDTN